MTALLPLLLLPFATVLTPQRITAALLLCALSWALSYALYPTAPEVTVSGDTQVTYYVTDQGHTLLWRAIPFLLCAPCAYALRDRLRTAWPLAFTACLQLGLILTSPVFWPVIAPVVMPRRYVDYPDIFVWFQTIVAASIALTLLGGAGLLFLLLRAALKRTTPAP